MSMSQPSISSLPNNFRKAYNTAGTPKAEPTTFNFLRRKRSWLIVSASFLIVAMALSVGLGVCLNEGFSSATASSTSSPAVFNSTNTTSGIFWQPPVGVSWQIVLEDALHDTSVDVVVYDIDLFDNPTSTITDLHAQNRSVICYFSAGSYEDFRPDANHFKPSDYAKPLDGWPGEYWLNTSSSNVRSIMSARIELAASKGCDGVDPDNVDGYDNDTGLDLTTSDAVDYLTFLANEAHGLNMSIGLKNAGAIVNETVGILQWEVNEQCVQYDECELFRPFIDAGKPVFHIEYLKEVPDLNAATKETVCGNTEAEDFSTVLKNMDLDDWVDEC